jgi:hypothetical protein
MMGQAVQLIVQSVQSVGQQHPPKNSAFDYSLCRITLKKRKVHNNTNILSNTRYPKTKKKNKNKNLQGWGMKMPL